MIVDGSWGLLGLLGLDGAVFDTIFFTFSVVDSAFFSMVVTFSRLAKYERATAHTRFRLSK